ncbi:MAG: hypothetical protein Q4P71_02820 [Actinomycetaceae bacterium]|nr:hypothetical protein [Actinomycetaceae bacterium]
MNESKEAAFAMDNAPELVADLLALDEVYPIPLNMDGDEWDDWFLRAPIEVSVQYRDPMIVLGMAAGRTLDYLGGIVGVTRERVRQIGRKYGVSTSELRKRRKLQQERRLKAKAALVRKISLNHPELEIEEIAEWVEMDERFVLQSLGPRRAVHVVERRVLTNVDRISDEELTQAIRQWYAQSSKRTSQDYDEWSRDAGVPGRQTVMIRYGTWNVALRACGLIEELDERGGVRPQLSDELCWASIFQFFREDLDSYAFHMYDKYARKHDLPSGPTVRNRFGSWTEIKEKIRQLFRYAADRDGTWAEGEQILSVVPEDYPRQVNTKESAVESLIRVAGRTTGPLTMAHYDDARSDEDCAPVIVSRFFGSWPQALAEAGLGDRMSTKARHRYQLLQAKE